MLETLIKLQNKLLKYTNDNHYKLTFSVQKEEHVLIYPTLDDIEYALTLLKRLKAKNIRVYHEVLEVSITDYDIPDEFDYMYKYTERDLTKVMV